MREAKRIKIVGAENRYWYRDLVGCTFSVVIEGKEDYQVVVGDISDEYFVRKEHAEVVVWIEPSYREQQAEWIKENDVKVGDKVRFAHSYNGYQDGFNYDMAAEYSCRVNNAYTIESIASDHIKLEGIPYPMPYFAFEPVTDMWRSYETWEEKISLVGKLVRIKIAHSEVYLVTGTSARGFYIRGQYYNAEKVFEDYEFLDGSPVGVNKLKELLE